MNSDLDSHGSGHSYDPTDRVARHRAWQLIIWSGMFSAAYSIFVAGAPRTGFFKELGFGPKEFGMVTGLSSLAWLMQFFSGLLSLRLARYRKCYTLLLSVSRLLVLAMLSVPIVTADMSVGVRVAAVCTIVFFQDALSFMTNPLWTAWMGELLPSDVISRSFAIRQKMLMVSSLFSMVIVGLGFHFFEVRGHVIGGYSLMATIGLVLGVSDIILYQWVPNPEKPVVNKESSFRQVLPKLIEPLRDRRFRPFLLFMAAYQLAMAFATPFYGIYILSELGFSVMQYQLLNALGTIAIVLCARQVGFLCDKLGLRSMLTFVSVVKFTTPLLFILAPEHNPVMATIFVGVLMFTDGIIGSGWTLSTSGYSIKFTPRENRVMYVAVTNIICLGILMGIMPIVAGALIEWVQGFGKLNIGVYSFGGYHVSFIISILLTFCTLNITKNIHDPGAAGILKMWHYIISRDTWRSMKAVTILQDSDSMAERLEAVGTLGRLHSALGAHELLEACSDPDADMRNASIAALEQMGNKTEITQELLGRALASKADRTMRLNNLHLLARVGDGTALVPLLNYWHNLPHRDAEMRHGVASALARLSGTPGTEAVINLLDKLEEGADKEDDSPQS